ncbi:hypothetical protein OROMI_002896 [Orobanche minor]
MLLGFISILLTVFQAQIVKICVPVDTMTHFPPCSLSSEEADAAPEGHGRHLLAEATSGGYCAAKDKIPLLSVESLHHLHIFIFVLAIVHVTFSVLTIVFGGAKCKQWEDAIAKEVAIALKINSVHSKRKLLGIHENIGVLRYSDHFSSGVYLCRINNKEELQRFYVAANGN